MAQARPSGSQAVVDGFGPAWELSRLKPPQAKPKPQLEAKPGWNNPSCKQSGLENTYVRVSVWGRDWVMNGAGKVSGLWGATLSGLS